MTVSNPTAESLAIIDAGGQYTKVIDRRVRELKVHTHILSVKTSLETLRKYKAIIISGGPSSVTDKNAPNLPIELLSAGIPILGICWGMQWINHVTGGEVSGRGLTNENNFSKTDNVRKTRKQNFQTKSVSFKNPKPM